MMHKSKYNFAPEYIKIFFLPNYLVHGKSLRNSETDFSYLEWEQGFFSSHGAQIWTSLDRALDKDLEGETSL